MAPWAAQVPAASWENLADSNLVRPQFRTFISTVASDSHNNYLSYKDTEAQREKATCPRCPAGQWQGQGVNPIWQISEPAPQLHRSLLLIPSRDENQMSSLQRGQMKVHKGSCTERKSMFPRASFSLWEVEGAGMCPFLLLSVSAPIKQLS